MSVLLVIGCFANFSPATSRSIDVPFVRPCVRPTNKYAELNLLTGHLVTRHPAIKKCFSGKIDN